MTHTCHHTHVMLTVTDTKGASSQASADVTVIAGSGTVVFGDSTGIPKTTH